jgi:hypothetical protein
VWRRDNVELPNGDKYELSPTGLTVNDIIHSDEGNYSCIYMNTQMQNATLNSGCLLVYGAAFFDSSHEEIHVNNNGTIRFNLSLAFTTSGNSGLIEEIKSFILANLSNMVPVAQCNARFNIPCTFSGIDSTAQWWTVEREEEYNVIFVLHQARSTNRGSYSAEVEGVDPATQSLRTIGKIIFVSVVACNKSSPKIDVVNATSLESTETEIS